MESTPAAWARADTFLADMLAGTDPALEHALEAQRAAGLPEGGPAAGRACPCSGLGSKPHASVMAGLVPASRATEVR